MKNDNLFKKTYYCDSCLHTNEERGMDMSIFSEGEPSDKIEFCFQCGQPILRGINPFDKDLDLLESALNNKNLKVICYTAPSVRVSLGDEFGLEKGKFVEGKMVSALKKLGFYAVFDMNTSADFTIVEEANEFVSRLKKNKLPMFTSCCPGWVNYCLSAYPKYKDNLSTTKSPQQMFGSLLNSFYAKSIGVNPPDIFVVSIVPCVAKKLELRQSQNTSQGFDVDIAITTRELAEFIKYKGIDFNSLKNSKFDDFFGSSSGAGAIFGNTGGVTEAVLRTVGDTLSKKEKENLEYKMVRGLDNIRRAEIDFGERKLKLAVVTGLKNVNTIMEELEAEPHKYDLVEVMACDGGCIGGAGQPRVLPEERKAVLEARAKGLYSGEKKLAVRKAHQNPAVKKVYKEFLGEVGGAKAKKYLHRSY